MTGRIVMTGKSFALAIFDFSKNCKYTYYLIDNSSGLLLIYAA